MGSLRARLRNLERAADEDLVVVEHPDGTTSKFRAQQLFPACFLHEHERAGRHLDGEDPVEVTPGPLVALRTATNLDALTGEQGTIVGLWLGEDEIIRGLRERPGPPVREASPGVYE